MAVTRLSTQRQFLEGGSDLTLHRNSAGVIELLPANLIDNAGLSEIGSDGEPVGFDLSWNVERIVAYHNNVSRPGYVEILKPDGTPYSPKRFTDPPKLSHAVRQTVSGVPVEESSWTMEEPWVAGIKGVPTSDIIPPAPTLETAPSGNKGFRGGPYGWAWLLFSAFGPTTATGVRFFTLANGEVPKFPVPDAVRQPGVTHWGILMTRLGGGASTLAIQRKVPAAEIREELYKVSGPWRSRGRPPSSNRSGVGAPPEPKANDSKLVDSGFNMPSGTLRVAYQIENGGGVSLLSRWGKAEKVKPDRERVKVRGPEPANVLAADAMPSGGGGSGNGGGDGSSSGGSEGPDPRTIRPSGKRSDAEYLGQEIDFEESRLVSLINEERYRRGLPMLVLNRALNRAAYRVASETLRNNERSAEEGYEGAAALLTAFGESPEDALKEEHDWNTVYHGRWEAVGVARENGYWAMFVGDDPELPGVTEAYCEKLVVEHVEEDGTVYSSDVQFADARLSFDLVQNGKMDYSYNGSFGDAVREVMGRIDAMGPVSVKPGGNQVAITDGNLDGAMARTYSNNRIIFDAAVMRGATRNARYAAVGHEGLHGLGFDHVSVASMLNTPIYTNGNGNHESPTSYDKSEYRSVYGSSGGGSGGSGSGGGNGGGSSFEDPPGGHGSEIRRPDKREEPEEPEEPEFHFEWRELPYKKNTSLKVQRPGFLRGKKWRGARWTAWVKHESPSGVVTTHRVVRPGSRKGAGAYFDANSIEVCCELPDDAGTTSEAGGKRKAPLYALLQEEVPTEDTTAFEPPDPTTLPDEPVRSGQEVPEAGRYLATVSGLLEGGGLTQPSPPGKDANGNPHLDITNAQLPKVNLPSTLNLLRNAEFGRLDANGNPEDWTFFGTGSAGAGYLRVEEGVLTLGATTTPALMPRGEAKRIPYDPAEYPSVTVAGTVGAKSLPSGSVRLSLRQLDEAGVRVKDSNGADVPDIVVANLAVVAEMPFSATYGALDPATAFLAPIPQLVGATGGAEGYFKNLRVLGLPTDVRYVEFGEDGATFDADPDVPVSGQSFIASAPAPEAEQPAAQEPEPPVASATFEGGVLDAGWTAFGNSPNRGVQAGAAIHKPFGYRVQDASMSQGHTGGIERAVPLVGSTAALRGLYVFDQLPTTGWVDLHVLATAGGDTLAFVRVGSGGGLSIAVSTGGAAKFFPLGVTLPEGAVLDVEPIFTPGKSGLVAVGVGINGRRRVVFGRGFDFGNRSVGLVRAGVVRTAGARTRYNLRFDQIFVTETGDVLDREKPTPPPGYVAPPLDRPTKNGIPRTFDHAGRKTGQIYALLAPGAAPPDDPAVIPLLDKPVNVRPGLPYTVSTFLRSVPFGDAEVSPGIRAWLQAEDGSAEPYVAASIPMRPGGWHPTGRPTAEEDDYMVVNVPTEGGYDQVRLEWVLHDGVHILDHPVFSLGNLTGFADRDARRQGGRAAAGSGEWIFDLKPTGYEHGLNPGVFVSEFGVKVAETENDVPVGSLATAFSTSQDRVGWLPYNSVDNQPLRYLRMALAFTGDGFKGPAAASLFARTWCPLGVLLRPDGTHFPGVAYIGDALSPSAYQDVEARRVGGRLVLVPQSDPVNRLEDQKITVGVSTEEARREVQYLSSIGPLLVEAPGVGGTVAGQSLLVVFGERLKLAPVGVPSRIDGSTRVLYAVGEADYAEVLEASPLQAPMKAIDFAVDPVLSGAVGGA